MAVRSSSATMDRDNHLGIRAPFLHESVMALRRALLSADGFITDQVWVRLLHLASLALKSRLLLEYSFHLHGRGAQTIVTEESGGHPLGVIAAAFQGFVWLGDDVLCAVVNLAVLMKGSLRRATITLLELIECLLIVVVVVVVVGN